MGASIDRWRDALLSVDGPHIPSARLVALAIHHLSAGKTGVRLRLQEIVNAAGVSRPSVVDRIRDLVRDGWLERRLPLGHGRAWASYEYSPKLPLHVRFHGKRRSQAEA